MVEDLLALLPADAGRPRPPFRLQAHRPLVRISPARAKQAILYGTGEEKVAFTYDDGLRSYETKKVFEGVIPNLERRWKETDSAWVREEIGRFFSDKPCEVCHGARLKPEALAVKIAGLHIAEVARVLDPRRRNAGSTSCPPRSTASRTRSPRAS